MKSLKYVLSKSILQECLAGQSTVALATTRGSQFLFFVTGLFTACHVMIANTALFMGLVSPVAGFSVAGFSPTFGTKEFFDVPERKDAPYSSPNGDQGAEALDVVRRDSGERC